MRAGEPLILHRMADDAPVSGVRQALCGDASVAWRCVDERSATAAVECARCLASATHQAL